MLKIWSMVLFSWNSCYENDFEKYYSQTFQNIACLSILSSFTNDLHYWDRAMHFRLFLIIYLKSLFCWLAFAIILGIESKVWIEDLIVNANVRPHQAKHWSPDSAKKKIRNDCFNDNF
jgi:hypothetical protein